MRTGVQGPYAAFLAWLTEHPIAEDRPFSVSSVRYQVARYCDYLGANPWPGGDPLHDPAARDGVMKAYEVYLRTFDAPAGVVRIALLSVSHFYQFLGLPPADATPRSGSLVP